MKKNERVVLWASAHDLSPEQRVELGGREIVLLKDVNPSLYESITNLSSDSDLNKLAYALLREGAKLGQADIYQPAGNARFHKEIAQIQILEEFETGKKISETYFADSLRESVEQTLPDGSVKKVAVFRHLGFKC